MIVEYYRPTKIEDALKLIARSEPKTIPIAGGSAIDRSSTNSLAVVDLQLLHLDKVRVQGQMCEVGAALTLQNFLESWLEKPIPIWKTSTKRSSLKQHTTCVRSVVWQEHS